MNGKIFFFGSTLGFLGAALCLTLYINGLASRYGAENTAAHLAGLRSFLRLILRLGLVREVGCLLSRALGQDAPRWCGLG